MDSRIVQMIVGASALVALLVYLRWRPRINRGIASAGRYLGRVVNDPATYKVAETFCNEAAVLWAVFPLLDEIYDPRPNKPPLAWAYAVAGMFFFFAVVLSHSAKGKEE